MRRSAILAMIAAVGLAFAAPVNASTIFTANLTHDQETAPGGLMPLTTSTGDPRPLSFGSAVFELNSAKTQMTMTATIFNIDVTGTQTPDTFDDLVAAHIHAPAPPGANAGVRWGFFGTPDNDNNPDNLVVIPFASGVGGVFMSVWDQPEGNAGTTLTTSLPALFGGLAYLNFHTVQFRGGEIRGQLVAPEPMTISLLGLGLLGLARRVRRNDGIQSPIAPKQ